ncbi:MAG: SUMF1/EgtB/PvdO family nonheme iron enzyme [Planctomycetota bacterium]|nr:SUMF1/EgtB/PvdO family nonheme iron enzyme [Planctomycetota bacterium]
MTDDQTMPLPKPPSEDPGETLRPERPVAPSNETVPLSGGGPSSPATAPTLIGIAAKSHAPHDGHAQSRKLGPYTLVRLLGRGGMGAVWEALDTRLNRRVAVKVMVAGEQASEQETERFRREARNSAKLRHPNIVPVHDFGVEAGQQYLVMDLVDGVMLADALRQRQFTYREKALLLEKVARAVQYAHEQGVVHRDLKPSNIMLEAKGGGSSSTLGAAPASQPQPASDSQEHTPLVMDFGLAKDIARDSSLSQSGQVMGTPAYMPPEQAEGRVRDIGPRSDVYSLGAILYEMLTGRVPFTGENAMQVLRATCHEDPVSPRRITPGVPRDLETVCLKCLEKEPTKRYESAQALADDLARWLRNEPIVVRPASATERLTKWVRRRPATAALIAVIVLSSLGLVGVGLWYSTKLRIERNHAQAEAERALNAEAAARMNQDKAEKARDAEAGERRRAEDALREAERENYINVIGLAEKRIQDRSLDQAKALLTSLVRKDARDLRGWEWGRLLHLCHLDILTFKGHGGAVTSAVFSPDGKRVVTGSADQAPKVWQADTGREILTLRGIARYVSSVAFSPDGKRIATGTLDNSNNSSIWDAETGRETLTLRGHGAFVRSVAYSPDGKRIITGSDDRTARIWDAETGREILALRGHSAAVPSAVFSPDGKRVATGSIDKTAKLWDAETGRPILTLTGHEAWVFSVAFSPDGKRLVTGSSDQTARIWDADNGHELLTLKGHDHWVCSVAVSPDCRRVATASWDRAARLWDIETGRTVMTFVGHDAAVNAVAFSPDGKRLVTGSEDKTAKVWDAETDRAVVTLAGHDDRVYSVAFSPNANTIVTGSFDKNAIVWNAKTAQGVVVLSGHGGRVFSVAVSPDGNRVVTGSEDKTAKIWEAETGREVLMLKGHLAPVWSVAFSPNGKRVATGSEDKTAKIWEAETGREVLTLKGHGGRVHSVAFSPDGTRVVTGSDEAETGREVLTLRGHSSLVSSVAFSPDGKRVVTGSEDKTARIWEADTGRELLALKGHDGPVSHAAFSPDGQRVVTGSWDKTAKVWEAGDWRTAKSPATVAAPRADAEAAKATTVITQREARVWPLYNGKEPVGDYARHAGLPTAERLDLGGVTMEFVLVPAGEFMMGSGDGRPDVRPVRRVCMTKPFYIGKYEVTVAQFRAFSGASGYLTECERAGNKGSTVKGARWQEVGGVNWRNPGFKQEDNHPVVLVTWDDAQRFVDWASKQTGKNVRLPTEAQWEYAARGPRSSRFPWGDQWDGTRANHGDRSLRNAGFRQWPCTQEDDGFAYTAPVGTYSGGASWCGAFDMVGNVWEWVRDYYSADYYAVAPAADPQGPADGGAYVLRGAGWNNPGCDAVGRRGNAGDMQTDFGFRVALDVFVTVTPPITVRPETTIQKPQAGH